MPYGETRAPPDEPVIQIQVADRKPYRYNVDTGNVSRPGYDSNKMGTFNPDRTVPNHAGPWHHTSLLDVGIFRDTLLPNLALHSGLALAAYGAGRATNRADAFDILWPTGFVASAWWSSVGRHVVLGGRPLGNALKTLSWPERMLLAGVTLWGGRTMGRLIAGSVARGVDSPRNEANKEDVPDFWDRQAVLYAAVALTQSVVALPFTAPFRHHAGVLTGYHPHIQMAAIGLFSAGFGLSILADSQMDAHKASGKPGLCTEGVWSLVRHPNYLGDALINFSFPLLLYASDMLAPIEVLGPIVNYVCLRWIIQFPTGPSQDVQYAKGDPIKETELAAYQKETNAFWPNVKELQNQWTWIVVGCGVLGVAVEQAFQVWHLN